MALAMAAEMTMSLAPVEAVVRFAQKVPVFPCRRLAETVVDSKGRPRILKPKSPLTERGFLDASQDPDQIRVWWHRWPDAYVGVPTGRASGLIVLDVDTPKLDAAAKDWLEHHSDTLMLTRSHQTLSGSGRHYVFRAPAGITYRSGVNVDLDGQSRHGIDLRADGGYVVWWPLHGGAHSDVRAMPLPAGLLDSRAQDRQPLEPLPTRSPDDWARDEKLVAEALQHLDPVDRDQWIRWGLAISLASGGSESGFSLWHAWSAGLITGDIPHNYGGEDDCRAAWQSFRHDKERGKTVTLGSLFHAAEQQGWTYPKHLPALGTLYKPEAAPQASDAGGLPYSWARDIDVDLNAEQLVEDLIFPGAFVLTYGESNTGKTFLVWDLVVAIAHGREWFGRKTRRGLVIYIAGEGFLGVAFRKKAYEIRGLIDQDAPLAVVHRAVNFLSDATDVKDLVALVKQLSAECGLPCAAIVVDTLARAIPGGSDAEAADMGSFIANADAVREATGAAVIAIHHAGKDLTKGARGHSSLRAAVDTELLVEGQSDPRTVTNTKQRDLERAPPFSFELELQVIGMTQSGKSRTSCVVKSGGQSAAPRVHLTTQQRLVLNGLRDALHQKGELPNRDVISGTFSRVPDRVLSTGYWKEFLVSRDILSGTDEAIKKAFNRAKESLLAQGLIHIQDGFVWLVK